MSSGMYELTEAAFDDEVERAKAEHPDWTEDEAIDWVRENESELVTERLWEEADYRYDQWRDERDEERWEREHSNDA